VLLSFFVVGCASGPNYEAASSSFPQIPPDKSRLVFIRESSFVGFIAPIRIRIDGKPVGSLPNGSALIIDRAPTDGEVALRRISESSDAVSMPLRMETGMQYYIEVGVTKIEYGYLGSVGAIPAAVFAAANATQPAIVNKVCKSRLCVARIEKDAALVKLQKLTLESPDPQCDCNDVRGTPASK